MATVLVVDDDPAICNLLREILEIDGHVIQTAVNGLEALDLARYRTFDLTTRRAWCEGQGLELTTTEFELLTYLAQRQGQVATYDELLEKVWNYQPETGSPEQVHTAMWRLRRKLERTPACPRLLATVRGAGYRLGSLGARAGR